VKRPGLNLPFCACTTKELINSNDFNSLRHNSVVCSSTPQRSGRLFPVVSLESDRIVEALKRRVGDDQSVAGVVHAIVSIWNEVDTALRPILGQRGVAMLYKRSLYLAGSAHGWIPPVAESLPTALDLAPLQAALTGQSDAIALDGAGALLRTFYELLSSLVGPSLTERLLRPVWDNAKPSHVGHFSP
jgi:hypothetical protein